MNNQCKNEKTHQFGINLDIYYWLLNILHLKC